MIRKRVISLAILCVAIGAATPAAAWTPVCTPAEEIRQRFARLDGAAPAIVSDPRYVAEVTQVLRAQNAPASALADRYLVVGIGGMLLVYAVDRDGRICAAGKEGYASLGGQAAKDLVKRLQALGGGSEL